MSLFGIDKKSKLDMQTNPFIQPEQYTNEELPIAQLIQRRRLQLLVHSRLYYELNISLISDKDFDSLAIELVKLQKDYPEISKTVCFADAFKDWDGTTGTFLPLNDNWVVRKTEMLLNIIRKGENVDEHKKILKQSGNQSGKETGGKKAAKQRSNTIPKGRCGLF